MLLRGGQATDALTPFNQTIAAAVLLLQVSNERAGVRAQDLPVLANAGHQATMLGELAEQLDVEVGRTSAEAEFAAQREADPTRALLAGMTGVIRSTATLADVCLALVRVAESLLVVQTPRGRVELAAAVEGLRAAVGTAEITIAANLPRITDARTYDQLAGGLQSFGVIRDQADRILDRLRGLTSPGAVAS